MKIPEELINHLEQEINIGNVDKKVQNLILMISEANQKYKRTLDKLSESLEGHLDRFGTINYFGACNDIIELLLEFKEILKEVE